MQFRFNKCQQRRSHLLKITTATNNIRYARNDVQCSFSCIICFLAHNGRGKNRRGRSLAAFVIDPPRTVLCSDNPVFAKRNFITIH